MLNKQHLSDEGTSWENNHKSSLNGWFDFLLFPCSVNVHSTNCTTGLRIEESHSQLYQSHTFAT